MSEVRVLRAKKASTKRFRPDADTTALDRDLKCAKLAEHIRRVVDTAPPLTAEQRARLASLLLAETTTPESADRAAG